MQKAYEDLEKEHEKEQEYERLVKHAFIEYMVKFTPHDKVEAYLDFCIETAEDKEVKHEFKDWKLALFRDGLYTEYSQLKWEK
jgi:hypothetical protein